MQVKIIQKSVDNAYKARQKHTQKGQKFKMLCCIFSLMWVFATFLQNQEKCTMVLFQSWYRGIRKNYNTRRANIVYPAVFEETNNGIRNIFLRKMALR